jgi:hypothetical protein
MPKIIFVTFSNTDFMSSDRIVKQAQEFDIFDKIFQLTEKDIPEYIEKHRDFINQYQSGYGYWIWKPKIILDTLNKIDDNDILIYADAGVYINKNGKPRFQYYLDNLIEKEIVVFETSSAYLGQEYTKLDAIMSYHPEFKDKRTCCKHAGLMIIKKTQSTLNLITDWLNLCENYHFIDDSRSINYNELSIFKGNDKDNGLFCLCIDKYNNIVFSIPAGEVLVYMKDGRQAHHEMNAHKIDWSILDDKPLQCRRLTPKFMYSSNYINNPVSTKHIHMIKWLKY